MWKDVPPLGLRVDNTGFGRQVCLELALQVEGEGGVSVQVRKPAPAQPESSHFILMLFIA